MFWGEWEMVDTIKRNRKFLLGIIVGLLISGITVYATSVLSSSEVSYDNSKSHSSADNVQGAIEELYRKSSNCTVGSCSLVDSKFIIGYIYNQNQNSENYCVTGDEETCVRTDCYTSSSKICPVGTIIDYIVSGDKNNKVRFHVMYDNGKRLTMQSQKNIVRNVKWYTSNDTSRGPLTVLSALEEATSSWTNIETQNYTMGETIFKDNAFTGCSNFNSCNTNLYNLESRSAKARMITVQEAVDLGCTDQHSSCPIWMYNYLYDNISYGATVTDTTKTIEYNWGYFLMNARSGNQAYLLWGVGALAINSPTIIFDGARAVVVVSK